MLGNAFFSLVCSSSVVPNIMLYHFQTYNSYFVTKHVKLGPHYLLGRSKMIQKKPPYYTVPHKRKSWQSLINEKMSYVKSASRTLE